MVLVTSASGARIMRSVSYSKCSIAAAVIKVCDTKILHSQNCLFNLLKKCEHASVLHIILTNCIFTYVHCCEACTKGIGGHRVIHDIQNAHINKSYAVLLFERSRLAQQNLHRAYKLRFTSHNCNKNTNCYALVDCPSWRNSLALKAKCVAGAQ